MCVCVCVCAYTYIYILGRYKQRNYETKDQSKVKNRGLVLVQFVIFADKINVVYRLMLNDDVTNNSDSMNPPVTWNSSHGMQL